MFTPASHGVKLVIEAWIDKRPYRKRFLAQREEKGKEKKRKERASENSFPLSRRKELGAAVVHLNSRVEGEKGRWKRKEV